MRQGHTFDPQSGHIQESTNGKKQPRLHYKRRMYSAHMKGAPRVPSLGDRGGCATGPCRTPTALGHTTKMDSWQLYLMHSNRHRAAANMRRQRNMAPMKKNRSELWTKGEDKHSVRCRVRNTGYKDAQGTL